jgi:hypothetical protein
MRLSRSSKHRRRGSSNMKVRHHMAPLQVASLLALSAYGIGQIALPTHALFLSHVSKEAVVSAAFVFPTTVNDIANRCAEAANNASRYRDMANNKLTLLQHKNITSNEAEQIAQSLMDAVRQSHQAAYSINSYVILLQGYAARAASDLDQVLENVVQQLLPYGITLSQLRDNDLNNYDQLLNQAHVSLTEIQEMETKINASKRVDTYIQHAYQSAIAASKEANDYAAEASNISYLAAAIISEIKADEEKVKEQADKKKKAEQSGKAQQANEPGKQPVDVPRQADDKAKQPVDVPQQADDKAKQPMDVPQQADDKVKQPVAQQQADDKAKQPVDVPQQADDKEKQPEAQQQANEPAKQPADRTQQADDKAKQPVGAQQQADDEAKRSMAAQQ